MKKLSLLLVILALGCVGSPIPRNPMKRVVAPVQSKTVAPITSPTKAKKYF